MSRNSKKKRDMKKKKLKKGNMSGMNKIVQLTPKGLEYIRQLQSEGVIS